MSLLILFAGATDAVVPASDDPLYLGIVAHRPPTFYARLKTFIANAPKTFRARGGKVPPDLL